MFLDSSSSYKKLQAAQSIILSILIYIYLLQPKSKRDNTPHTHKVNREKQKLFLFITYVAQIFTQIIKSDDGFSMCVCCVRSGE